MGYGQTSQDIIEDLADLFPEHETMETMDSADFKDNAVKIWELVERARNLRGEYS